MIKLLSCILFTFTLNPFLYSQTDSTAVDPHELIRIIDSLKYSVKEVFIIGNEVTKEEIILREMSLKRGSTFTYKKFSDDYININRLGLFTKADITPYPINNDELILHVEVQERFYILPLPKAGIEDGEWKKLWLGADIRWDNFRGRNEQISLYFRILYNPSVTLRYKIPWIGEKLHLFTEISGSYSKSRNYSLEAVGKLDESKALTYEDNNFDNYKYGLDVALGKYINHYFNVYTLWGYDHLRVSEYAPGRTLSPTGVDKYLTAGFGLSFDSRNANEFATEGYYFNSNFRRYGLLNKHVDYGRIIAEAESYIPFRFSDNYFITAASRFYSSNSIGAVIPYYDHEYLGYSSNYVRGWKGIAFEGEDALSLYNEFRIPIIKPAYLSGKDLPFIRDVSLLSKFFLKYGLYFTMFYDIASVWNKSVTIQKAKFMNGAGIGLNAILPFDYIVRFEWAARLSKPVIGQLGFSLSAKF